MRKIAIVDLLQQLGDDRVINLMRALGRDRAVYFYGRDRASARQLEIIEGLGLEMVADDYPRAFKYDLFLADYNIKRQLAQNEGSSPPPHKFLADLEAADKRLVYYTHSLDIGPSPGLLRGQDFFLAPTEAILYDCVGDGKYLCDAQKKPEVGRTSRGAEMAVAGLFHISDAELALMKADRSELRAELARRLGVRFQPELPLVSYFVSCNLDPASVDRGLTALARQANVLIKQFGPLDKRPAPDPAGETDFSVVNYSEARGENVFETNAAELNWLIRLAADANLASFMAGGFISMTMLGMRVVPILTQRVMSVSPRIPVNYTLYMRYPNLTYVRLAYCLAPIHVEATELLAARIGDQAYWERFEREIPRVQESIFGRYLTGDQASERAARLIVRALDTGTFTPSPQELPGAMVGQGPISLGFPIDITL